MGCLYSPRIREQGLLGYSRTYKGTNLYLRSPLVRVKLPRGEVFAQLLASGLDEPGVLEDPLNFLSGGVAANVLFLEHLSKVRPVLDTVDDVLKYLILSPGAVVGAEEPVPEGSLSLGHFRSQPPSLFCASLKSLIRRSVAASDAARTSSSSGRLHNQRSASSKRASISSLVRA